MSTRSNTSSDLRFWCCLLIALVVQLLAVVWLIRRGGAEVPTGYGAGLRALNIALPLAGALLVRFFLAMREGIGGREARNRVLKRWWDFPLVVLAFLLVAEAYMWGKVFVPAVNSRLWDRELADLSTWLTLGVHPNVALLSIFNDSPKWLATLMDYYYSSFVVGMLAATAWFTTDEPRRRKAFFLSVVVLWSGGFWFYIVIPCLGPVYIDIEIAREVKELFPLARTAQHELAQNYQNVLSTMNGRAAPVHPALGVAAMPSLHVGAHALFFFWCCWLRTRWRTVFLVMTMLTFLGSVATGWHWSIDGWAGIAVAGVAALVGVGVAKGWPINVGLDDAESEGGT